MEQTVDKSAVPATAASQLPQLWELLNRRNQLRNQLVVAQMEVEACAAAVNIVQAEDLAREKSHPLPKRPSNLHWRVKKYLP